MMLRKCQECGHDVSGEASVCRHCGTKPRRWTSLVANGLLLLVGVGLGFAIFGAIVGHEYSGNMMKSEAIREQVRSIAGADPETVNLVPIRNPIVVKGAADQIAAAHYTCHAVAELWAIEMTLKMEIKILKAKCVDGGEYQVTFVAPASKGFVKPWTGILVSNLRSPPVPGAAR